MHETPGIRFARTLPAKTYAVFRVTGGLVRIPEVFRYAYDQWIPASGYEIAYPFDFERYDEDYKGDTPESELENYIPVQARTAGKT